MPLFGRQLTAAILSVGILVGPVYPAGPAEKAPDARATSGDDVPAASALDTYPSELEPAIERYESDLRSIERRYALAISPSRDARLRQFYQEWLDSLGKWDFAKLGLEGKVDYVLFHNDLKYELRQLDVKAKQYAEMEPLLPFAKTVFEFEDGRRRMETLDARHAAELVAQMKKQIDDVRKAVALGLKPEAEQARAGGDRIKPIKTTKFAANRAAAAIFAMRESLKRWNLFYNGYDPLFDWWVSEPYKTADKALDDYRNFLREQVVGIKPDDKETIVGDPIGRDALMLELAHEMIPYTPEELIALARKELTWCEGEITKVSRELGYGDDWHKAMEKAKQGTVEPGKQPEMIRKLAEDAVAFVREHDYVTVPQLATEDWGMLMMSPERQLQSPFFLGGEDILVSYPTDTMTEDQKLMSMRGNNYGFSHATVFHELIPGHHLQFFMMQRYKPYRRMFHTPFWTEGWALYCELMFWDMGFDKTPDEKIGALFWRMHRCARIIFSLSFHLGKMTPQECIDFLVEHVGHERDNAAAEVRRSFAGDYSPLYQAGYLLGGFQFRALHRELVETGKMKNREMHDRIMRENNMPVEMVRALLTGQAPAKDFKASWKFYGDVTP